jgi:hypothetical protein
LYSKLLVYKSCIRPILCYRVETWYNCATTHKKKLQIIQNIADIGDIQHLTSIRRQIYIYPEADDGEGFPIALGAPKLEGPVGFFPPRYMTSPPLNIHMIEAFVEEIYGKFY